MVGLQNWVKRTRAIASKNHGLGEKILYRKTKRIKLNRAKAINCEVMNGYKIFHDMWNYKNITKIEGFRRGIRRGRTDMYDWKRNVIANDNIMR